MAIDIQGFKFDNAPARWELVPNDPEVTSVACLLAKFYEEFKWGKKPLGWVRNPESKDGNLYFGPMVDVIVAPYRRNFYIVIERGFGALFGPHVVRLFYRSDGIRGEIAWVGICQIDGMWHSDERMLKALLAALEARELYHSPETADLIVYK